MSKRKVIVYKMSSSHIQIERIDDALRQLNLGGMRTSFDKLAQEAIKNSVPPYDYIERLAQQEMDWRNVDQAERRIKAARLPFKKTLEDYDFSLQPTVNPQQIYEFASCRFIQKAENIVFLGPEGVGKTHFCSALAQEAIFKGYRVRFYYLGELIDEIKKKSEGYQRQHLYSTLYNTDLFILDEIGFYEVDDEVSTFLFKLLQQRYEKGSVILASQFNFDEWGNIFGNEKRTNAILGRISHHATVVNIDGPSYRLRDRLPKTQIKPKSNGNGLATLH